MTDDPDDKLAETWAEIALIMPGFGLRAAAASLLASADDSANPPMTRAIAFGLDQLSGAVTPPPGVLPIGGAPEGPGGSKLAAPSSSGPLPLDTPEIISDPSDTTPADVPAFDLVEALASIQAYRARPVSYPEPFSDPVVALRGALDLLEHGAPRAHVAALIRDFLRGHAERAEMERLATARPTGSTH